MKNITKMVVISLVTFLALNIVNAKENMDENSIKYFKSKENMTNLYYVGIHWDREILQLETDCEDNYAFKIISFSFLQPLEFDKAHNDPVKGAWTSRINLTRCGSSKIYNILSIAREGQKPETSPLVPGSTRASPQLLQDFFNQGIAPMIGMKTKTKDCVNIKVLDTEVTLEPTDLKSGGKQFKGVWEEKWIVKNCAEKIELITCFIPDGKGGTSWSSGKCKT